jgi:SAM-dependent methyltransferase
MASATPSGDEGELLGAIYAARFSAREIAGKRMLWDVLVRDVFQRYVPVDGTVLDLGAGRCEFTNAVRARRRIAVDLDPAIRTLAAPGVEALVTSSTDLGAVATGSVDCVFTSNFFEHLRSSEDLLATLREVHRVLALDGRLVVLMPNARYLGGAFWDYLDHHLPLTQHSLAEALTLTGFEVLLSRPRFLPYTVRGRLPVRRVLVRAYLRFPPAWRLLGKQMLVVARPLGTAERAARPAAPAGH